MNVTEAIAHLKKVGYNVELQSKGKYTILPVGWTKGPHPAYLQARGWSNEPSLYTGREVIGYARRNSNKDRIPTNVNKEIKDRSKNSRRMKERVKLRQDVESAEFDKEKSNRWDFT